MRIRHMKAPLYLKLIKITFQLTLISIWVTTALKYRMVSLDARAKTTAEDRKKQQQVTNRTVEIMSIRNRVTAVYDYKI